MSRQALAVFDLDRTLITSSSATVFRKHLAEHGLGGAHDLPLVDVFTRYYEQFGENWLLMQPARLASRASAGWSTATVEQAMRTAAEELATLLLPGAAKAIEEHRATGCRIHASHDVKAGRFASTVGPDKTKNFSTLDFKRHIVKRSDATKLHGDISSRNHRLV